MPEGHVKNLVAAQSFVSTTLSCLAQTWDFPELKDVLPASPAFGGCRTDRTLTLPFRGFPPEACALRGIGTES